MVRRGEMKVGEWLRWRHGVSYYFTDLLKQPKKYIT